MVTSEQLLKFVKDASAGNKFMDDQLAEAVGHVARLVEIEKSFELNMSILDRENAKRSAAAIYPGLGTPPMAN